MQDHDAAGAERIPAWKLIHLKRAGVVISEVPATFLDRLLEAMAHDETEK